MSDIFISYKREEQPVARKLADALQKKGWSVWWDPKLRAGEHFDDAIERALNDAKCVIVMWSKLSVKSRYVKDEATYALNRNKLVPITIEEVDLPFRFEGIQTGQLIDWDGSDNFPGFQKLVADIVSILGAPPVELEERERKDAKVEAKRERKTQIEQKKEIRAARRKKIDSWRSYVDKHFNWDSFLDTSVFSELKPFLSEKMVKELDPYSFDKTKTNHSPQISHGKRRFEDEAIG